MWTPKRIVLLAGGFVLFTLVYILYTFTALGRINTLPPLPEQYKPSEDGEIVAVVRPRGPAMPTPLERKLEMAFHPGCEELKWPVLLELNSKSMVIAAWKFEIADGGRVKLELMSLAIFGKKKNDGRAIEINTLKCRQAYIKFDKPVTSFSPSEMSGRKIVEAELYGDTSRPILITNNRRSTLREDDLVVRINNGPLHYFENKQLVTTMDHVHLTDGDPTFKDGRLIPSKAVIDAEGMEMELMTTAPPPKPGVHIGGQKPKNESISGVKRIVLNEAVRMNLCVANGGPFPGSDKNKTKGPVVATPEKRPPDKNARPADAAQAGPPPARVLIETPGRFEYEIFKDHDMARFDVPTNADLPGSPQDVTVTRINEQAGSPMYDMLVCKHLELRLKRRNNEVPAARDASPAEQGLDVEWAHATGPNVTLTSDAERLDAHGIDFFHDSLQKLTILKGTPYMEANKEDSLIQAPELRLQEVDVPVGGKTGRPNAPSISSVPAAAAGAKGPDQPAKTYQRIQASGPGSIHMTNKTTGKQNIHACWKEQLLSERDPAEPMSDKLTLTDSARFEDDEHGQTLKAETLKVWLLSEDKNNPQAPAAKDSATQAKAQAALPVGVPGSSRKPTRVEALRNVFAHSSELNIHDAARLVIKFIDVPPERMPPPSSANNNGGMVSLDKKPAVAAPAPAVRSQESAVSSQQSAVSSQQSGGGKEQRRDGNHPSPTVQPVAPTNAAAVPSGKSASGSPSLASGTGKSPTVAAPSSPPAPEPARPIDLSARSIEADVLRCNDRMALDHLWAEGGALDAIDKRGGVKVIQEPAKPGEDGVYIEGNTLDMRSFVGGNVLVVTGDLAQLKMDKILILGPEVNIDQVLNKAWVVGAGAMQMQSTTTLEGKPLVNPVPLTVHWSDHMLFSGNFAQFDGSIQAMQNEARLACQTLQVIFDRPISLKEGMQGSQPAKVSKLVGDKGDGEQMLVEDQTFEGGRLQKYQLLIGTAIQMTTIPRDDDAPSSPPAGTGTNKPASKSNDANKVTLSGPGTVRILQRGGLEAVPVPGQAAMNQPPIPGQRNAGNAAPEQQMKLTYISFEQVMQASSLTNVANFWGSVRVLNLPCDDPHRDIDLDEIVSRDLPEGALYLRCNRLRVLTYQKTIYTSTGEKQLRTYQAMDALGQVYVAGRDFTAQCDHMTFNEEKDQVIFEGEGDNRAVMSKGETKGDRKTMAGKRVIYIRSTGAVYVDRIDSIDG